MKAKIQLPATVTLESIDFKSILRKFSPSPKSEYKLPRITFIGYFQFLSLTRQREICKHLGFEYFSSIEMATTSELKMNILQSKWSDITKMYTRLIVIGNHYDRMPEWEFDHYLYKKYKGSNVPVFRKHNIPCIMESELFKLNLDYPNIHMNTIWEGNLKPDRGCL